MGIQFLIWSITFVIIINNTGFVSATPNFAMQESSARDQSFHMESLSLPKVPSKMLEKHPGITSLFLQYNNIKIIRKDDFPPNATQHLVYINIRGNYIKHIEEDAFSNMPNLHVVDLNQNALTEVPKLKAPKIRELLLRHNKIRKVDYDAMQHYKNLVHFDLKHNKISMIYGGTFRENKKLVFMVLSGNPLREIEETAFIGPDDLQFLYLENTKLRKLPSKGISSLTTLNIRGTPDLISLPDPGKFEKLADISVEYSMHCCAFRAVRDFPKLNNTRLCPDSTKQLRKRKKKRRSLNDPNITDFMQETDGSPDDYDDDPISKFFEDIISSWNMSTDPQVNETDPCDLELDLEQESLDTYLSIKCSPEPDEFNPCEDVMGTHVLRVFSWFISIFAVIGNIFQLVILFSSKQELSVYKLLMYNLGFSNLLMGIYLMILCCVDGYTYGKYYNFAQSWQYNGGCKTMGFIALFATQLSVCSLLLITVERFLLIIFALQVQNQMKLKHAMIGIAFAWLYSFIVALLPLTDIISSYTKVAICLPMSMQSRASQGYMVWLLLSYIIAFLLIVFCYIRMYINISEVRPGNSSQTIDIQVAKRMSMIIFSNFLCWLPISFAGIMALYSKVEFNVGVGKFLLVFIFPLNACTNPFLYAIFTKVFRGDTLALLSSCGLFKFAEEEYKREHDKRRKPPQTALQHFVHVRDDPYNTRINSNDGYNTRISSSISDDNNAVTQIDSHLDTAPPMGNADYHSDRDINKTQRLCDISESPIPKRFNKRMCGEPFDKLRFESKQALLDADIKQCRDPRFRSDTTDTCSTGFSRCSVTETDEEFARMIGSIQKAEGNMLLE